jgi:hypothetical protein
MIEQGQIVEGARVRASGSLGTITSVDAAGIVTVRWDFGLAFAYTYDAEAKRLEVYTGRALSRLTPPRRTGGTR